VLALEPALQQLHAALERAGSPVAELLAPGLDGDEIGRLTADLPFALPEELVALYRWHDGLTGDGTPKGQLFPGGYWLSLRQALEHRAAMLRVAADATAGTELDPELIWRASWMPAFIDFFGDTHVVVCERTTESPVWFVAKDDPDHRPLVFDGIASLVRTAGESWSDGVFAFDRDGVTAPDEERYAAVWRRHNPAAAAAAPRPPASADMARALSSADARARADAARDSVKLGADAPLAELRLALADSEADVRGEAAAALGMLRDKQSADLLTAMIGDPAWNVRTTAVFAVGMLRYKGALDAVIAALSDPEFTVRLAAARALAKFRSPQSVPALVRALEDPARDVRQVAAGALARIRHPDARAAVERLVDHDDPVMRGIAERAAGN
jgi:cell wall assembly regulator SMI1